MHCICFEYLCISYIVCEVWLLVYLLWYLHIADSLNGVRGVQEVHIRDSGNARNEMCC